MDDLAASSSHRSAFKRTHNWSTNKYDSSADDNKSNIIPSIVSTDYPILLDGAQRQLAVEAYQPKKLRIFDDDNGIKKEDLGSSPLGGMNGLLQTNVELFLKYYASARAYRLKMKQNGFSDDSMPKSEHFNEYFHEKMTHEDCGLFQQMRLATISNDTIRRAASSALYFLVFMGLKKCSVLRLTEPASSNTFTENVIHSITEMTVDQKADMVSEFILWYDSIPTSRISPLKKNIVEHRAAMKENSTLNTVTAGLLAFFTYSGCIMPSSCVMPTKESQKIWKKVKSVLNPNATSTITTTKITTTTTATDTASSPTTVTAKTTATKSAKTTANWGDVKMDEYALSVGDISKMLVNHPTFTTPLHVQSIMLALLLSGTGLNIGSIRAESSTEENDHKCDNDVDKKNRFENGNKEVKAEEVEATTFVSFDYMSSNDVKIWRCSRHPNDHPNNVRLRAEISVTHSRNGNIRLVTPEKIMSSYPKVSSNGVECWMPNETIALLFLSAMIGNVDLDELFDKEREPLPGSEYLLTRHLKERFPLLRASNDKILSTMPLKSVKASMETIADEFKIPARLFTSRSFSHGYAKGLIETFVTEVDSEMLISHRDIQRSLSSNFWQDTIQANRYIQVLLDGIQTTNHSTPTACCWQQAIYERSPWAKLNYHHLDSDTVDKQANNRGIKYSVKERRVVMDISNVKGWKKAQNILLSSPEELRDSIMNNPKLDLKKTIRSFNKWIEESDRNELFGGFGGRQQDPPYSCPVNGCYPEEEIYTSRDSIQHWQKCHKNEFKDISYFCVVCNSSESLKYQCYRKHLIQEHPESHSPFRWEFL